MRPRSACSSSSSPGPRSPPIPGRRRRPSPQLQLIALREQALKRETALVNTILRQRAAAAKQSSQPISATPARPAERPRGHPAAPDDHEDVVMERHEFHAMGTTVECLLDGDPRDGFARVEAEFERLEALLSRFRPESELSRLNREGSLEAGPDLLRVDALALEARERSGGLFDPTVLDAVVAAGYDRSFELVPADGPATDAGARCGGGVRIDGRPDRARAGDAPRPRRDRQGLCGRPRRRAPRAYAALPRQRGRRPRRARRRLAGRRRRLGHARADTRRDRHLRPRPAALEPRRRGAAPPDRSRDRPSGRGRTAPRDRRRRRPRSRPRCWRRSPSSAATVDVPRVLVTADGRTMLAGGLG